VDLRHGIIVTGVGMLRDFEVGWFDKETKAYRSTVFETPHELLSLNGSVAVAEGEGNVMPHVHASLAGPDHGVVGGHLYKATTAVLNEVAILRVGAQMRRRLNPETGLMELDLGQP
jgi:predicted DNA-binding protein with PD1-like motif